jgi:C4-dicarboxylate-specific signal transduction histidine kinase
MEFHELQQIVESNARSIQALADRNAEISHQIEDLLESQRLATAEREQLRQATIGIANLLSSLDSDRPTILRKLSTIEKKIDRILEGDELPKSGSQIEGGDNLPA